MSEYIRIASAKMQNEFERILLNNYFDPETAKTCAQIFTDNSLDGVYSHGVNRFIGFIDYVKAGHIVPTARPEKIRSNGALEQWHGHLGPGPLNALSCAQRATELAHQFGIGCVALSHTNHWMRGGYYAWDAVKRGCAYISWANTKANMPAWGARDCRLGNNPLVLAVPLDQDAIVLDMAMSQYSYGAIANHQHQNQPLQVPGGYNEQGQLTTDAGEILKSERALPMGYWKGAGLSLLLDILASVLSDGLATYQISQQQVETANSNIFIAFDLNHHGRGRSTGELIKNIIDDYLLSTPDTQQSQIHYPGQKVLQLRVENMQYGVPVLTTIWQRILAL